MTNLMKKILDNGEVIENNKERAKVEMYINRFPYKGRMIIQNSMVFYRRDAVIEMVENAHKVIPSDEEFQLKRLYEWIMDDNREPANTKFTAGPLRNVAREIEFKLKSK